MCPGLPQLQLSSTSRKRSLRVHKSQLLSKSTTTISRHVWTPRLLHYVKAKIHRHRHAHLRPPMKQLPLLRQSSQYMLASTLVPSRMFYKRWNMDRENPRRPQRMRFVSGLLLFQLPRLLHDLSLHRLLMCLKPPSIHDHLLLKIKTRLPFQILLKMKSPQASRAHFQHRRSSIRLAAITH